MATNVETARGERIEIQFEAKKCIHSRHCVLGRPDVFVPNVEGEWIHPDRAARPKTSRRSRMPAPSGAITYRRLDGLPNEQPPVVNVIRVRENGPLAVHAPSHRVGVPIGCSGHGWPRTSKIGVIGTP